MRHPKRQFLRPSNAVHWLVAIMLGVSAIAWAWHVDLPVPANNTMQVADAHAHQHSDNDSGSLVERCDHCCHAGAHLAALVFNAAAIDFDNAFVFAVALDDRLTPQQADPPYIPPIV